jgi:DNA-binding response OmpR family regulator
VQKILIVDDEPALRQTLGAILKRSGFIPVLAGTGQEGLGKLGRDSFSLIFLDIKLPDVMGVDLLPKIHQIDPDLPVVILTAHATLDAAIQAVRGGARDFLVKPIDPKAIINRVDQILQENKEPQRQREIISQVQDLLAELHPPDISGHRTETPQAQASDGDAARFLSCGMIKADLHTQHIEFDGAVIPIPPSSFEYLITLMRHSPEAVSFEALVKESQGYECSRNEARDITRWHMHKLRKALEQDSSDPQHLITVRDLGYRLVC